MKPKDYYLLLGVNKHSSKDEIKQNYRKLAKKYHPDANIGSPEAEEIFKDLTVAYDTLMDKEKKRKYDRLVVRYGYGMPDKSLKNGSRPDTAKEFLGALIGLGKDAKKKIELGAENLREKMAIKKEPKKGNNIEAALEITLEEGFFGAEKKLSLKGATGKINNYTVQVPRGIKDNEKIRLAALGKPGINGGKNGDLIITIKIKEHPILKLEGTNIYTSIDLTYAQAVIGDKIKLKILNEIIDLEISPMAKEQDKIVIPKKGYITDLDSRGDLVVQLHIKPPKEITDRERKIYEQLLRVEKQEIKEKLKSN